MFASVETIGPDILAGGSGYSKIKLMMGVGSRIGILIIRDFIIMTESYKIKIKIEMN